MNLSASTSAPNFVEESKFVEVLTSDQTGDLIGYRIGGARPGPSAVLAGDPVLIDALFERFMAVPTLPWMWGQLHLFCVESTAQGDLHNMRIYLRDVTVDGLVMLPFAVAGEGYSAAIESGYWAGLRLCRQLGMIEGRGVKPASITADAIIH